MKITTERIEDLDAEIYRVYVDGEQQERISVTCHGDAVFQYSLGSPQSGFNVVGLVFDSLDAAATEAVHQARQPSAGVPFLLRSPVRPGSSDAWFFDSLRKLDEIGTPMVVDGTEIGDPPDGEESDDQESDEWTVDQ